MSSSRTLLGTGRRGARALQGNSLIVPRPGIWAADRPLSSIMFSLGSCGCSALAGAAREVDQTRRGVEGFHTFLDVTLHFDL